MRTARLLLLPALALLVAASGARDDDDFYAMRKNFEIFGSFYEELVGTYVTRVDPERFMRTGIDAMLETLDPWTDFLDEADNVEIDLRGRRLLGDVGLSLGRRDGRVTVLTPEHETAAHRQGVRTGDVLVSVDGQPADSLSVPDVRQLLRGEPGTVVGVVVEREGTGTLTFGLRRESPVSRSVAFAGRLPDAPEVAYLRLAVFGNAAGSELGAAYRELERQGPIRSVILDLRGNPGGLLSEAIAVSALFVGRGTPVVTTRGRSSQTARSFRTESEPLVADLPLAVLVDRSTASASEIVAGAVQDLDRGVIVGEPTFGKGLVQVVRPLGYNTSLKVTMSAYFTPSGRGIRRDGRPGPPGLRTAAGRPIREGNGIEPEIEVVFGEPGPLEQALDREAAFFLYAGELVRDRGDEIDAAAAAGGRMGLPEDALGGFGEWLRARGFQFRSGLEEELSRVDAAQASPRVREALETLRRAVEQERDAAFVRERARLQARLVEEVSARRLGPTERIRASLSADGWVAAAREALRDEEAYRRLLSAR